jgi:hypothetical protein
MRQQCCYKHKKQQQLEPAAVQASQTACRRAQQECALGAVAMDGGSRVAVLQQVVLKSVCATLRLDKDQCEPLLVLHAVHTTSHNMAYHRYWCQQL